MKNIQPIEKSVFDEEGRLNVVKVWSTIQGEGPFTGTPAVFVRLAGCNLQCPLCDTNYTTNRKLRSAEEVADLVQSEHSKTSLVVLTGGEPFRQNVMFRFIPKSDSYHRHSQI